MPGKGTARRAFRIADELYDRALAKAQAEGTTLTEVIVSHLRNYVAMDARGPQTGPTGRAGQAKAPVGKDGASMSQRKPQQPLRRERTAD